MPSPFPGMDPYLERGDLWVDFHYNLATEIQRQLNPILQPAYYATLAPYITYDLLDFDKPLRVHPDDVVVWKAPSKAVPPATATAIAPAPIEAFVPSDLDLTLFTVEVRTASEHELVTAIEILSPVNKRRGHEAHEEYLYKRRAMLRSRVHLLEIDLLRGGARPPLDGPVPVAPYYVVLSRSGRRPVAEIWPLQLADALPVLPVPLRAPDPDVPLDLGTALATIYTRAAYSARIDYRESPPPPALPPAMAEWVEQVLGAVRGQAG